MSLADAEIQVIRAHERLDEMGVIALGAAKTKPEDRKQLIAQIQRIARRGKPPVPSTPRRRITDRVRQRVMSWLG